MPSDVVRVKIQRCSVRMAWYRDIVGQTVNVTRDERAPNYWMTYPPIRGILKSDCREITNAK